MKQKVKSIETVYNGRRFRSRLEARWAVFFDVCEIEYSYEPEGFETDDGTRYRPNFYLPKFDAFAEVKRNAKGAADDINKCISMIKWGGPIKKIIILSDIPGECYDGGMWHFPVLYWRDSGVVCGWWFFCDILECVSGNVSSSPYNKPFTISGNTVTYPLNGELSICAVSDVVLRKENFYFSSYKYEMSVEEYIQSQLRSNAHVFTGFRIARKVRFDDGETPNVP